MNAFKTRFYFLAHVAITISIKNDHRAARIQRSSARYSCIERYLTISARYTLVSKIHQVRCNARGLTSVQQATSLVVPVVGFVLYFSLVLIYVLFLEFCCFHFFGAIQTQITGRTVKFHGSEVPFYGFVPALVILIDDFFVDTISPQKPFALTCWARDVPIVIQNVPEGIPIGIPVERLRSLSKLLKLFFAAFLFVRSCKGSARIGNALLRSLYLDCVEVISQGGWNFRIATYPVFKLKIH